jgi:penicillin-binding protein 2
MPDNQDYSGRSGRMIEEHAGFDSRVVSFYVIVAAALLVLACGLAYQQLMKARTYSLTEQQQTERRIIIPGPRGNIYDRNGVLLVGNSPRFTVVLYLDELQQDFFRESIRIRNNFRATGDRDLPTWSQLEQIAHITVAQRYLDQVDAILGRSDKIDADAFRQHFNRRLYMPYTLVEDLSAQDFAKLLEHLPVRSPLQLYTTTERNYPFGSAASHVLGYVGASESVEAEDFPGEDLKTFSMRGTLGRDGLEKRFDPELQGQPGGLIFRVDQAGYKVNPPIQERLPVQGKSLRTSLDIDLQLAAEQALQELGEQLGTAVALDPNTGEVLVLASKPDYDLNKFYPHMTQATVADIQARGAWPNVAIGQSGAGLFPPGSTFKTIVTIAGLRRGTLSPTDTSVDCEGYVRIGNRVFACDNGNGHHGRLDLREAIAKSCDIYFWEHGLMIGPQAIADEARRFHLDQPTGIELPGEPRKGMIIPDPAWKKRVRDEPWTDGDTANMAIGQGDVQVTPLIMACYAASLARNETYTVPTLLHDPNRAMQHTEPIGLTPEQRSVLIDGMEGCTKPGGTADYFSTIDDQKIPGVRIAGKTGTAQYGNHLNIAWFICFAPIENPQIAIAIAIRSDQPGENYGGGRNAGPVADAILKKFFEKQARPSPNTMAGEPRAAH